MLRIVLITFGFLIWFVSCQQSSELNTKAVFSLLNPTEIGIDFRNDLDYDEDFNVYLYKSFYNGAGVGLGDINNDGLLDIFFCGNQVDNRLYLNKGGFSFEDITDETGLASSGVWSNGVSIVDINGDGWLDIYVCKAGKPEGPNRHNELFINQGINKGDRLPHFVESAAKYGINDIGFSVHAAFFDMDRDGDLDMYLLNNSIYPSDIVIEPKIGLRELRDPGGSNKLYRNDGHKFTDVTERAGIYSSAIGFGLGVAIGDINRDGWQDIYVANDYFERDYLYINNKDGSFKECIEELIPEISQGSMGVDIADINHDGYPEVFVTEMLPKEEARVKTKVIFDSWEFYNLKKENGYHRQFPRNSLQLNNGISSTNNNVSFSEISRLAGVEATDWSWSVLMADFDNNGQSDIMITNGIFKDLIDLDYLTFHSNSRELRMKFYEQGTIIKDLIDLMPSVPISNHLYAQIDNLRFEEVSKRWGVNDPGFSNGIAYGDIDNDGDLDLVINNINMPPFIYRNNSNKQPHNHFLEISLKSIGGNIDGIGSQVTLYADGHLFYQELFPMRGAMSTASNKLHFGLGNINQIDSLEVLWPEGEMNSLYNIQVDQFLVLSRAELSSQHQQINGAINNQHFVAEIDTKSGLNYLHNESEYIDFDHDRLLNYMISNEGPKIAVGDVNKDGLQDMYIGGAKGYPGGLFQMDKNGLFAQINTEVFERDKASEDTDAIFADIDNDGDEDLLVASGSYEFSGNSYALANRIYLNDGKGIFSRSNFSIPNNKLGITSCLSVCDFDNDGDQDVFVGGRVEASAYGIPTDSYLLKNDGKGTFSDVTKIIIPDLNKIGMVTDACWLDYDLDGDEDLFVCGDWMPIKVFRNNKDSFTEITGKIGFSGTNGFWNTIQKVDLDNDGDLDLIAGNLGLNTQMKASAEKPVSMFINDFDHDGKLDHIITVFNGENPFPIATKDEITGQMPYLSNKFTRYEDYKEKTINQIFTAGQMANTLKLEVYVTSSMVFWNEGDHFVSQELPVGAQLAPIYSILVEDLDHDGSKELLMGGNQYRAKPQTGIYAGSFGVVVKQQAPRQFGLIPFAKSGFFVGGEIRDMKKIQIQGEERILVARNNDSLKIFKINQ